MLNYLKAELWRYFRRPAGKALLALSLALPGALVLYVWGGNRWIDSENPITLADTWAMAAILMPFAGVLFLMAIIDAAFADENRLGTMKNSVAAGFSRCPASGLRLGFFFTGGDAASSFWNSTPGAAFAAGASAFGDNPLMAGSAGDSVPGLFQLSQRPCGGYCRGGWLLFDYGCPPFPERLCGGGFGAASADYLFFLRSPGKLASDGLF